MNVDVNCVMKVQFNNTHINPKKLHRRKIIFICPLFFSEFEQFPLKTGASW